ncbi:MAG: DUF3786 domain-containing protein [Caldilineaceae bacterium]
MPRAAFRWRVGDCGFAFRVLPAVTLAVVYWRGDDEFAPEAHPL